MEGELAGGGDFAGEGNLLRKVTLPRPPTLLKLLGRRLGSIEGERLKSESSRSLAIFQQSLPLRFWGKGVWGRGPFGKRAFSPKSCGFREDGECESEESEKSAEFTIIPLKVWYTFL